MRDVPGIEEVHPLFYCGHVVMGVRKYSDEHVFRTKTGEKPA
jgi:hypothetical protein